MSKSSQTAISQENATTVHIANPLNYIAVNYIISLGLIALLSIAVLFMLDGIVVEQNKSGKIISISGQQRMLSQRVNLFVIEYVHTNNLQSRQSALDALDQMEKNHELLLQPHYKAISSHEPSPFSEEIEALYFSPPHDIHNKLLLFADQIKQALSQENTTAFQAIYNASTSFLDPQKNDLLYSLDAVVERYEFESAEKISRLRIAQNIILAIIILTIITEALFIFRPTMRNIGSYAELLRKEANYDYLSGLLNSRAFSAIANKALSSAQRHKTDLSVLMFDLDKFKKINDQYGHPAGDKVIKKFSTILSENSRSSDSVARIGGEEFIILLPDTNLDDAKLLAEKLIIAASKSSISHNGKTIKFTASCGASQIRETDTGIEAIINRADNALYKSKRNGRNQVSTDR